MLAKTPYQTPALHHVQALLLLAALGEPGYGLQFTTVGYCGKRVFFYHVSSAGAE
jgi:hypothetical protein